MTKLQKIPQQGGQPYPPWGWGMTFADTSNQQTGEKNKFNPSE